VTTGYDRASCRELRRIALGVRDPSTPLGRTDSGVWMESRGPRRLMAYACFACRRSFKRPKSSESSPCPLCGGTAYPMGRAFRVPPRSDAEQWLKVQALYALGFRFSAYGSGDRQLPDRLADVEPFVRLNPHHYCRTGSVDRSLLPASILRSGRSRSPRR